MKLFAISLVFVLAFVRLQNAEATRGVLGKFVKVTYGALNVDKEKWGGDLVTPEQCAEECLRKPYCAAFEMEDTTCFLLEKDATGDYHIGYDRKRNYYQKIRPYQELIILRRVTIPAYDNIAQLRHVRISECAQKCRGIPLCKAFDFKDSAQKCDLSNETHLTNDLYPSKYGWDIYIFNPDYKPIECGNPPHVDRAFVKFKHTDYLSAAIYTLETGETYTMICGENSKWGNTEGICKKTVDCGFPSPLRFAVLDYKTTTVNSTAVYTCIMGEKYTVVCGKDGNWTKPSGVCRQQPRSCKEFQNCGIRVPNGDYWIYPQNLNGSRIKVYCAEMTTDFPKEYIDLKNDNFALSSPLRGYGLLCLKRTVLNKGRPGKSLYTKVRIFPETMEFDISDFDYVRSINGYGKFKQKFATARDCLFKAGDRCDSKGAFQIDLKGTGLAIDKSVSWKTFGFYSRIQFVTRSKDNQVVRGVCGGKCGGCEPDRPLKVNIFNDDQPHISSAKFCQNMYI